MGKLPIVVVVVLISLYELQRGIRGVISNRVAPNGKYRHGEKAMKDSLWWLFKGIFGILLAIVYAKM